MTFSPPEPMPIDLLQALDPPLNCEEWAMLDMMRCLFVMHAEGSHDGWSAARQRGAWYFGPLRGGRLLLALSEYIEVLRQSRKSPFWFSNPRCSCCRCKITEEEERLIAVVRARRMGLKDVAMTAILIVCEGVFDKRFLEQADKIGALLNEAVQTPCTPTTACPSEQRLEEAAKRQPPG